MRGLKIFAFALAGLIALLIALLLAVHLFVTPNDFKGRITAAVKSSTGRELSLPGDIKLSVFPSIALELGPATLGSPPGFGDEPFAAVQHVALRVRLLPLLHKELDIGRVQITGLDLTLKRNAAGRGNWQGESPSSQPPSESKPSAHAALPDLAGVEIKDSRIAYQQVVADKVNLDIGHVTANAPIPVALSLDLSSAPGAQPLHLSSRSEITLDLVAQTLAMPSFMLQLAAARLSGDLSGTHILDAPVVHGRFKLEPVALHDLMAQLGMTPPVTRDPKALSWFALSTSFDYGNNAARLQDLAAQLDESTLKGRAAISNLDTLQTSFDLALDHIDIDRYLAPERAAAKEAPSAAATGAVKPSEKSSGAAASPRKSLDTQGTLTVGSAKISGLTVSQVHIGVLAKDGVTHLAPISAKLYGGDAAGDVTLDSRAEEPILKLQQNLTSVDMAPLLQDFANTRRLSGRGDLAINLTTRGQEADAILKSMAGRVGMSLTNGAVEGIDVWFEINRALALIQKQAPPSGSDSGRTRFDTFKASADIADGVATTGPGDRLAESACARQGDVESAEQGDRLSDPSHDTQGAADRQGTQCRHAG